MMLYLFPLLAVGISFAPCPSLDSQRSFLRRIRVRGCITIAWGFNDISQLAVFPADQNVLISTIVDVVLHKIFHAVLIIAVAGSID